MTNTLIKLLAFATLAAFLGILVWHVPRFDLGGVVLVTAGLIAWDFFGKQA